MRRHRGWPSASGSENDLDRVPGLSDESESFRGLAQREDVCDEVREVPFVRLLHAPGNILSTVDDDVGARLPRCGLPKIHNVGRDYLRSPGRLREFDVKQSGDAAAEYEHRASRTETREPLPADH